MADDGSSSGGGLIGSIIGAVIGFVMFGPVGAVKGFMYGSTAGGLLAPPTGPDQFGPRLSDLTVSTSSNVAPLPRTYGKNAHKTNMIYCLNNQIQETVTSKKVKTGLFSSTKIYTYHYYLTAAYSIARGPLTVLRVWFMGGRDLVYSAVATDMDTINGSANGYGQYLRFYPGDEDQLPDPIILAQLGPAGASAWRGVGYMMVDELPLQDWQNSVGAIDPKIEYTTVDPDFSPLELVVNIPADAEFSEQDEYARLHVVTNVDAEGAHLWRVGLGEETGFSASNDSHIYHALPSGELINMGGLEPLLPGGEKSFNRPCAGKSDRSVMLATAVYISEYEGGGGGGGQHPYILQYANWVLEITPVVGSGSSHTVYSIAEGLQYLFDNFDPDEDVYHFMFQTPPVESRQETVLEPDNFEKRWMNQGGPFDGAGGYNIHTNSEEYYFPGPITADMFDGSKSFSTTLMLWVHDQDRATVDQFIIGGFPTLPNPQTHYVYYQGKIYFVLVQEGIIGLKKITHFTPDGQLQGQSGAYFNVDGMSEEGPPPTISLIKIGMLNDELIFVCEQDNECMLFVLDITVNLDDLEDGLTDEVMTFYDAAAVLAEFGDNGPDFYNNISPDFDKLYYCLDGHVYRRETLLGIDTDLGEAPDLILGDTYPAFFNIFGRGNLLAVSTFGEPMPNTGVQWFTTDIVDAEGLIPLADIITAESALVGLSEDDIDVTQITAMVRGFTIATRGAVRNGLEQLRAAYPFDNFPSGYKVKFVPRGGSSVMEIPWQDLVGEVLLNQEREMETQLPYLLVMQYMDETLRYEINEQASERPTNSEHQITLSLSIVLTADEAAQKVDILHNVYEMERIPKTFTLPSKYSQLETADIVTLNMPEATHYVRIASAQYASDGKIQISARTHEASSYTSNAVGAAPEPLPDTIPSIVAPIAIVLDLPLLNDLYDEPGYMAAMTHISPTWAGGTLYRQTAGNWDAVQGFVDKSVGGNAIDALGEHGGHVIQTGGSLTLRPINGTLPAATEAEFMSQQTLLAYGRAGRWEMIAYRDRFLNSDGTITISTFLRGLYATEHNTGLHENGDIFLFIGGQNAEFVETTLANIGTTLIHRAVNSTGLGESGDLPLLYEGQNLLPYSPVSPIPLRDADGTLRTYFSRRDRKNGGLSFIEQLIYGTPMSEAVLKFEIDIMEDETSTAEVLRTITVFDTYFEYSATDQITDFGSIQAAIPVNIYPISAAVGRGHAGAFIL